MVNTNYPNYYVQYRIQCMYMRVLFFIKEEDTSTPIEVMFLNMSLHQFFKFVRMVFVNSYRVDCELVNCINNCNS